MKMRINWIEAPDCHSEGKGLKLLEFNFYRAFL